MKYIASVCIKFRDLYMFAKHDKMSMLFIFPGKDMKHFLKILFKVRK